MDGEKECELCGEYWNVCDMPSGLCPECKADREEWLTAWHEDYRGEYDNDY